LFAESLTIIHLVHTLLPNISILTSELLVITVIFLLLRQFGQGIMAMVSRNTLAKWFERRRGIVSGISGIFVAFSFSGAPLFMNIIIEDYGYSGSMILMAIIFGFGMAFIGWLFFRDKPEDCGLLMDGDKITSLDTTNLFHEPETTLKEALRLGADGVSLHINIGGKEEPEMLADLGMISEQCHEWNVPLLAMMYPRGENIKNPHDPEIVAHTARIGAECGADIVKTLYTGDIDSFSKVVDSVPVPLVIAGGPKTETDMDVLQMTENAMKAGAKGVT